MKILDLYFFQLEKAIASFLLETTDGPVLFETGPYSTYPALQSELHRHGYKASDIKHVFLTHIHLDHAGAAWAFAELGATVYLHPFGKKHMADPSRLMDSAQRIYGDMMDRMWGAMKPIEESRLQTVTDAERIMIGDTAITAWHTPGHAIHHVAWEVDRMLVCGDVAGVRIGDGPVVPPCPPPDINIETWLASIERIREMDLDVLQLTHWGTVRNIKTHLDELKNILFDWAQWILLRWEAGESPDVITPAFQKYTSDQLRAAGADDQQLAQYEAANPAWMSVSGLIRYWTKKNAG